MNAEFHDVFVHGRMKIIQQLSKGNGFLNYTCQLKILTSTSVDFFNCFYCLIDSHYEENYRHKGQNDLCQCNPHPKCCTALSFELQYPNSKTDHLNNDYHNKQKLKKHDNVIQCIYVWIQIRRST